MEFTVTEEMFGLWMVIVYPSVPPGATVGVAAIFVVVSGVMLIRENVARYEATTEPELGTVTSQLSRIPLSSRVAQSQVLGPAARDPMRAQIELKTPSI